MAQHSWTKKQRENLGNWLEKGKHIGSLEIKQRQEQSTHMLQIPKADVQIPEQDPQEMGSIYFSLENQINLVQASQTPDDNIEMHPKQGFV